MVGFTNALSSADIGKTIELFGVGQQVIGNNVQNQWVTNYQDILAVITNVIGTNAYLSVDIPQQTSNNVYCIYGTNNANAIMAAIYSHTETNTLINFPAGNFLCIPYLNYTNYYNEGTGYWVHRAGAIFITKGGLTLQGAGEGATILTGQGAWRRQGDTYSCVRGTIIHCLGPITNDYPLIIQDLTFDGGLFNNNSLIGSQGWQPANTVDGQGWDGTSAAATDIGAEPLHTLKIFNRVEFRHFLGEMIKSITSSCQNEQIIVTNCFFGDGNATAFNYTFAHTITDCTFSNLYQIEEFYLEYSNVRPSLFVNNYATNIFHNLISLNGGTLTNQPYIISNNVLWCNMDGNGIGTCPAANVVIASNFLGEAFGPVMVHATTAIVMGQAGAQGGSPDACNTNYDIYGNTFKGAFPTYFSGGGAVSNGIDSGHNIRLHNNTCNYDYGPSAPNFLFTTYITDFQVYSNVINARNAVIVHAYSGGFPLIQSNNIYQGKPLYFTSADTNIISYGTGPKQYLDYVPGGMRFVLNDSEASQIPAGAYFEFDNRTNRWNPPGNLTVQLSQASAANTVTLTTNSLTYFYWNAASSYWTNSSSLLPPPATVSILLTK